MKQVIAGVAGLLGGACFFVLVGPHLRQSLQGQRPDLSQTGQAQVLEARVRALPAEDPLARALAPGLARDEALARASDQWSNTAASLLSPAQRQRALELAAQAGPMPAAPPRQTDIERDMWVLADAIVEHYGFQPTPPPEPASQDTWIGLDRRSRAHALWAIVQAGELEPDQAQALLAVTLQAIQAQVARVANLRSLQAVARQGVQSEAKPGSVASSAATALPDASSPLAGPPADPPQDSP